MKKLLVSLISVILIAGVVGTCFALYTTNATQKSFTINAGYEVVNLTINNGANTGAQGNINLSGFKPDATTQYVDVTLVASDGEYDSVHGNFSATLTGELSNYIDTTVRLLDAAEGDPTGDAITAAAMGEGYDVALSSTPVYVRLTFTLNAAACADFSLAANTSAALTLNWEIAEGSVFTYDADAYYLVGKIDGEEYWYACSSSVKLTDAPENSDLAKMSNVHLTAGDKVKVLKGETWYGGKTDNTGHVSVGMDNGDITVNTTGYYDIYVNDQGRVWISVHV